MAARCHSKISKRTCRFIPIFTHDRTFALHEFTFHESFKQAETVFAKRCQLQSYVCFTFLASQERPIYFGAPLTFEQMVTSAAQWMGNGFEARHVKLSFWILLVRVLNFGVRPVKECEVSTRTPQYGHRHSMVSKWRPHAHLPVSHWSSLLVLKVSGSKALSSEANMAGDNTEVKERWAGA